MECQNRCLFLAPDGSLAIETTPLPTPDFGQVLIRVEAVLLSSACLLPSQRRKMSSGDQGTSSRRMVPGSAFCGIIFDIGPGVDRNALKLHERVAVESRSFCGT
jgi:NADPH:quinone reductase-like Zn-dependent oxidoreductase